MNHTCTVLKPVFSQQLLECLFYFTGFQKYITLKKCVMVTQIQKTIAVDILLYYQESLPYSPVNLLSAQTHRFLYFSMIIILYYSQLFCCELFLIWPLGTPSNLALYACDMSLSFFFFLALHSFLV